MDFANLNRKQISAAFGVNERTIARWVRLGFPQNPGGITYNLSKCILWSNARARAEAEPAINDEEMKKWAVAYRREKAIRERILREKLEETLISKSDVTKEWSTRVIEIVQGLENLSNRLPPLLEGKSKVQMFEIIRGEIRYLRTSYAREGCYCPAPDLPVQLPPDPNAGAPWRKKSTDELQKV